MSASTFQTRRRPIVTGMFGQQTRRQTDASDSACHPLVRHDVHQMRIPTLLLCPVVGLGMLLTSCSRPADHALGPVASAPRATGPVQRLSQPQQKAVAGAVDPDRRVGAIFTDNGPLHVCTGSVVHSAGGNLMMTAAHCLAGASQITFVPGLVGDAAPAEAWKAEAVYLDPRWTAGKDPHADYAIARVSNDAGLS